MRLARILKEPLSVNNATVQMAAILNTSRVPVFMVAHGILVREHVLIHIAKRKRKMNLKLFSKFSRVINLVRTSINILNQRSAFNWLKTPNPYLNDVAPIQYLRSNKEFEKVMGLLTSIQHGFPA